MHRLAGVKPPLKEVDKFFGKSLYKNEATLFDETILDLLDTWFVASIVFYVRDTKGANKLKYAMKQQVQLNKRTSSKYEAKNNRLINIKTIFTLSKEEYTFLYKRLIKGFQQHLATIMEPVPLSRPSSRYSARSMQQKDESKSAVDEPPMAGDDVDEEAEKAVQLSRNLSIFSELTQTFLQNCVDTDWQNDRDELLTISKVRIYSLLHEIVVYSIIGRKRKTPSRIKETLELLFDLSFPEVKLESDDKIKKMLYQRKNERMKTIKNLQEYVSPYKGKEIRRRYPKPWLAA